MDTDWLDDLDLTLIRIAEDYVTSLAQQVPSAEVLLEEVGEEATSWDTPILPSKPFKRRRLQPPSPPHPHRKRKRREEEEDAVVPQKRRLLMRFSLHRPYGTPLAPTHPIVFPPRDSLEVELVDGGLPLCPPTFPWGYKRCYFNSRDPYAARMSEDALRLAIKWEPRAGRRLTLSELGVAEESSGAAGEAAGSYGSRSLAVRLQRRGSSGELFVDPSQFAVPTPLLTRLDLNKRM